MSRMISAREACRILLVETGLSRQQARRVLLAGLAGAGAGTESVLLYEAAKVQALAGWTEVDHAHLLERCPGGVFVLRLGPDGTPQPELAWDRRVESLRLQPDVGVMARIQVRLRIERSRAFRSRRPSAATPSSWAI